MPKRERPAEFQEPRSLEEAEIKVENIVREIKEIERRFPLEKAVEVRSKLRAALDRKVRLLHHVKDWIADERNKLRAGIVLGEPLDPSDPKSLLRRALFILRDWAPSRPVIKDDEWAVVNAVERFVMRRS